MALSDGGSRHSTELGHVLPNPRRACSRALEVASPHGDLIRPGARGRSADPPIRRSPVPGPPVRVAALHDSRSAGLSGAASSADCTRRLGSAGRLGAQGVRTDGAGATASPRSRLTTLPALLGLTMYCSVLTTASGGRISLVSAYVC